MRNLEVIKAFSHSVKSVRDHFPFAFHVSWPWMLAILPINLFGNVYVLLNQPAGPKEIKPEIVIISILIGLCSAIAFSSIAVSWHRYILLGDVPQGWARLRIDNVVWRYFGNTILMALIGVAAGIGAAIIAGLLVLIFHGFAAIILIPAGIAFFFAAISYGFRLGIKLPSIAIGRKDYRFGDALRDGQGNFWQFVGLAFLIFLTALIAGLIVAGIVYLIAQTGSQPLLFVSIAVQLFLNWLGTIWNVTILTSLYGFFAEKRDF